MNAPGQSGRKIAERYLIESLIGTGAFGHVFSAKGEKLGRTVALKVMAAEQTSAGGQNSEVDGSRQLQNTHPAVP